ncbi:uncharacterized protein LOC122980008 [Thunnus albacares]|uniref:uncharacterized protein LOC122980008 n=1 Tax=Thunnus albacares TaxID=8236 RepID=UPI001CF67D3A|nr:uncharacterized protein LOC122980008 [Thunnus albacares]
MALLAPSSTLLVAISSSPLPFCSPASHHFISLQYIYPSSSSTHRQIVVSAQVCSWTITRLPACQLARSPVYYHLLPSAGRCHSEDNLRRALPDQENLVGQRDQVLTGVVETLRRITASVSRIESQLNPVPTHHFLSASGPPAPTPPSDMPANLPREPHVPAPECYNGYLGACRSFLLQCSLVFEQQPQTYSTDKSKVAYVIGLLTGEG